jgi:hypothetical protein
MLDHAPHFGQMPLYADKVGGHAVSQHFGLSDIDNFPRFILHEIDPGALRQCACLFAKRRNFVFHFVTSPYETKAARKTAPHLLKNLGNAAQVRGWRLKRPSACKFPAISHKNAREYIQYSPRFLFHLTKNFLAQLSV